MIVAAEPVSDPALIADEEIRRHLDVGEYPAAFEILVGSYKNRVFRLCIGFLRNEAAAEDLSQDVFVRIWKGLPGYNGQASLSTWIYTIARNTCFTEMKRQSTRRTISMSQLEENETLDRVVSLQANDAAQASGSDAQTLLSALPEKYRQVITLFYLDQKSYEEVSAMLGIPLGTVKTFLYRARRELLKIREKSEKLNPG
jgi:RNA polymerase sigma-70 factor (ECF subfamily)